MRKHFSAVTVQEIEVLHPQHCLHSSTRNTELQIECQLGLESRGDMSLGTAGLRSAHWGYGDQQLEWIATRAVVIGMLWIYVRHTGIVQKIN